MGHDAPVAAAVLDTSGRETPTEFDAAGEMYTDEASGDADVAAEAAREGAARAARAAAESGAAAAKAAGEAAASAADKVAADEHSRVAQERHQEAATRVQAALRKRTAAQLLIKQQSAAEVIQMTIRICSQSVLKKREATATRTIQSALQAQRRRERRRAAVRIQA